MMYFHSRCCNAHWELVVTDDGLPELRCEKCGKFGASVPALFAADGRPMDLRHDPSKCELCRKEGIGHA
jgi:hypothetical protein